MGIKTHTIAIVTCDVCDAECGQDDGDIRIQVNNGDGRDVGPAYISGKITFSQPYKCISGIVCRACKIKWLKLYITEQERQQ